MRLATVNRLHPFFAVVLVEQHSLGRDPVVAVDLDNTLAKYDGDFNNDKIGEPRERICKLVRHLKKHGFKIIVFTCRDNDDLVRKWLNKHDVPFDTINANVSDDIHTSGKVLADIYLDDKAVSARHRTKSIKRQIWYLAGKIDAE